MKPLSTTSSIAFVGGYSFQPSVASLGVQDFLNQNGQKIFQEGSIEFDELRYCLLRESEQSLLMALNCYTRALEGLRSSSVYWSSVSLYYASFFAAKSILGMYGCWMAGPKSWIDVVHGGIGKIKLQHKVSSYTSVAGSHQTTWIAYYNAMSTLASFLTSTNAVIAKTPVNNKKTWLIETRNDLNYYPQSALSATQDFENSFNAANVPTCFKGRLQTMLKVSQACVLFAKESALRVSLSTDVWQPEHTRADYIKNRITGGQHAALSAYLQAEIPSLHF